VCEYLGHNCGHKGCERSSFADERSDHEPGNNKPNWIHFFPEIYDEDWLFLYDSVARRTVGSTGMARQLPYDPFAGP
jgi:hypothetical protein